MYDFQDQTVILTGAAGHLGQAAAQAFAVQGANLALVDRDPAALRALVERLICETGARPDRIAEFATDLLQPEAVGRTITAAADRFGGIRILVNIAGGFAMGSALHETDDRDWDAMFDLNARTLFHCVRATVPHLLSSGGGRIVTVGARAALRGSGRMGPYCAAKAAVVSLTETLADELRDQGIAVNCVLPSIIDTPPNRAAMPDQDPARWVSPAALAEVICFLASDAARAITGAAIPVYGRC